MPTFKTVRFDSIAIGTEFVVRDQVLQNELMMACGAEEVVLVKKANLSAHRKGDFKAIPMRAAMKVELIVPDPTPEELAAKAAEQKAWTIKWFRSRLASEIESCEVKIARFAERLAANPYDAFEWGNDAAIAAGKLRAFKNIAACFEAAEEKGLEGYEEAKKFALRRTVDGAKFPQHSTAALSNIVHEAETSGYAEFAVYGD